jgi:hypothetical protein
VVGAGGVGAGMVRLGVAGDVGGVVVGVVGVGSMRWMGVLRSCFKPALIFGRLMPVIGPPPP